VSHFGASISYFVTEREMLTSDFREFALQSRESPSSSKQLMSHDADMTTFACGKPDPAS
jgi:hypothetical protein